MNFRSALPAALVATGLLTAAITAPHSNDVAASATRSWMPRAARPSADAAEWDIPVVRNRSVLRYVRMFTDGSQQEEMALYLERSGRYEGMIRQRLRDRGMPEDLVYLSLIESGFNPTARSHASAVGLWQFMAPTARDYGLRVDGYVDERRDPERATDAALRYLRDLHAHFGSWGLAAAAYNTGQGRVERVMREETGHIRGDEESFWRIRHRLPRETREYVPLMMAAALIGKEPHKYGHGDVARWMPLRVDSVKVPGGTELETVAAAVGASETDLARLNPHLVQRMTPPGRAFPVRIPRGRSQQFAANWERASAAAGIRQAEERREEQVRERTESTRRTASRQTTTRRTTAASRSSTRRTTVGTAPRRRTHIVRNGESLWTIARRNDLTVAQLKRANGLRTASVRPGQQLYIPRS
jgi:membrane-bound lytic murein transglycosylase D